MKKSIFLKFVLPLTLIAAIVISGTFAILYAQTNKITNEFEYSYNGISVVEPNFNHDDTNDYEPGEHIPKDPSVVNNGDNEAFVYISVFNPHDIFTYKVESTKWDNFATQKETHTINGKTVEGTTEYYSYTDVLAPTQTTEPIFNYISIKNFDIDVENDLEDLEKEGIGDGSQFVGETTSVVVKGYAVSTEVIDTMEAECISYADGEYSVDIIGPNSAWKYMTNAIKEQYDERGEAYPPYLNVADSLKTTTIYSLFITDVTFDYMFEDAFVNINATECDRLDYRSLNTLINRINSDFSLNLPLYQNDHHMYSLLCTDISNTITEGQPLADHNVQLTTIILDTKGTTVFIDVTEEGMYSFTAYVQFATGEQITKEAINQKLEENGYGFIIEEDIEPQTAELGGALFLEVSV